MEESENSPDSPYLGEIKRMHRQCVAGAPPFFVHAGDKANSQRTINIYILFVSENHVIKKTTSVLQIE